MIRISFSWSTNRAGIHHSKGKFIFKLHSSPETIDQLGMIVSFCCFLILKESLNQEECFQCFSSIDPDAAEKLKGEKGSDIRLMKTREEFHYFTELKGFELLLSSKETIRAHEKRNLKTQEQQK